MRTRAFGAAAGLLFFVLILWGCGVTIARQNPRPNIASVPQKRSLRLTLGPAIAESLHYPNNNADVRDWRETLEAGFKNGFGTAYALSTGTDADLTLTLDEVRLEFGYFDRARARLEYQATITSDGVVLGGASGTATKAKGGIAGTWGDLVSGDVDGAVEAMYEQIAKDLANLAPKAAAAPARAPAPVTPLSSFPTTAAPRCVPGQSTGCIGPKGCQGFQVCKGDGSYGPCDCGG